MPGTLYAFDAENDKVRDLRHTFADATLLEFYGAWSATHVPGTVDLGRTSSFLGLDSDAGPRSRFLLELFVRNCAVCSKLYNEAIEETGVGLNPLRQQTGELPFFAVWRRGERLLRSEICLEDDVLQADDRRWPLRSGDHTVPFSALTADGVVCLPGKALLLVLQTRLAPDGFPLVLPYQGSLYMPAAHRFESKLRAAGILEVDACPIRRMRFRFLDRLRGIDTIIHLPPYLQRATGEAELSAAAFAEHVPTLVNRASTRLESTRSDDGRKQVGATLSPNEYKEMSDLEPRRRELARDPACRQQAGALWNRVKELQTIILQRLVDQLVDDFSVAGLDYWDSRGALLPASIGLGGKEFYEKLLDAAECYDEGTGTT